MSREAEQVAELIGRVTEHATKDGASLVQRTANASALLLEWFAYLRRQAAVRPGKELFGGGHAALIEVAACLSLGLVRPALFSMRAEVDMVLAWLYFKDHPVEWRESQITASGRLRGAVIQYLKEYVPKFDERWKLLSGRKRRTLVEPYALLSKHVHSQAVAVAPSISRLSDVVKAESLCSESVVLQAEVAEYLSDVFAACFADNWSDLPTPIMENIKERLGAHRMKEFCR